MRDQEKTREGLIQELEVLRSRLAAAEYTAQSTKADQPARQTEEDWARTFDAIPDLIAIIDCHYRIERVNRAMAERLGVASCDLVGRECYRVLHDADSPPEFCPHARTQENRQMHAAEIHENRLCGDFMVTTSPLFDPQGNMRGCVHVARDITQRKEVEEDVRRMQVQLTHAARLTTMGEMVAGIAHEVNQPLFSILNFAKAVRNLLAEEGSPQLDRLREWNEDIALAATRAGEIIKRLRRFVRRTDGQRETVPVDKLIEDAVAIVAHELRENRIEIDVSAASGEATVAVDRVQIQQVLVNLLRNARESLQEATTACPQILIGVEAGDGVVEISVADNGPGIPGDRISKLFKPFFTTKQKGLGLGLVISKTIVESHGGKLWADDRCGPGATFRFSLPLSKSNVAYREHADAE